MFLTACKSLRLALCTMLSSLIQNLPLRRINAACFSKSILSVLMSLSSCIQPPSENLTDQICNIFENAVVISAKCKIWNQRSFQILIIAWKRSLHQGTNAQKERASTGPDQMKSQRNFLMKIKWIYELYWKLRGLMQKAIKPLTPIWTALNHSKKSCN